MQGSTASLAELALHNIYTCTCKHIHVLVLCPIWNQETRISLIYTNATVNILVLKMNVVLERLLY